MLDHALLFRSPIAVPSDKLSQRESTDVTTAQLITDRSAQRVDAIVKQKEASQKKEEPLKFVVPQTSSSPKAVKQEESLKFVVPQTESSPKGVKLEDGELLNFVVPQTSEEREVAEQDKPPS